MTPTAKEYKKMSERAAPKSHLGRNMFFAFLIGGAICAFGQLCLNVYKSLGLETLSAASTTSITLIFLSALLTGLNVYDKIATYGGAGTLVPITGFANAMVAPALEFKTEGYVMGIGAKLFSIAGPVIVYGVSVSIVYGIILYLFNLY